MLSFIRKITSNKIINIMILMNIVPITLTWYFIKGGFFFVMMIIMPIYWAKLNFNLTMRRGKRTFRSHFLPSFLGILFAAFLCSLTGYIDPETHSSQTPEIVDSRGTYMLYATIASTIAIPYTFLLHVYSHALLKPKK